MDHPAKGRQSPPLNIRFVSGRQKDGATQSVVRSHAMAAVRSRQRHQKQLETERNRGSAAISVTESLCQCQPLDNPSTAIPTPGLGQGMPSAPLADGHRYCTRCGRLTPPSLLSHSQQIGFLRQQHPTIATFAAADFDPFESMAGLPQDLVSKFFLEINAIKAHATNFCSPGPIKSIVFPEAVRTPALMTSILYMTYAYLSSVRGWANNELALGLKTAAISHVNKKLSNPTTALCTNTIASIAYLSSGTWAFGNAFDEVRTHMNGMELMVKQRGMNSLGVYPFGQTIRKYLILHHTIVAAINIQPASATFDFNYTSDILPNELNPESPLYCPTRTLNYAHRSKYCSQETIQILYNARDLIDLLIDNYELGIDYGKLCMELSVVKAQLESHRSASDPQSASHGDWIFESCRLAALIILRAIETATPLTSSDPSLTLSLVQALGKTNIGDNWGDMLGVLYWVSMVGLASNQQSVSHRLLDSILGRAMFEMAFTCSNFGFALRPVQRFATLQLALKQISQPQPYSFSEMGNLSTSMQ